MVGSHRLRYGAGARVLTVPRGRLVRCLSPETPPPGGTAADVIGRALRQPHEGPPLRERAAGKRSAAILVPGKARLVGARDCVPAILAELNEAGIPDHRIDVFLA